MSTTIDFRTLRSHDGSRREGFEELCCQLLALEPPVPGARWVRKNGAGGDEGVEGYWICPDGSETAVQAKYFLDAFGESQLRQLDHSYRAMIAHHGRCTRYPVCVPRDLTDRRSQGTRKAEGQRQKWNRRLEAWRALDPTRDIKVELIDASALTGRLTRLDDPRRAGIRAYWFGATVLTPEWFAGRLEAAIDTLGARYTPAHHVELPLARELDALVHGRAFRERLAGLEALPPLPRAEGDPHTAAVREGAARFVEEADAALDARPLLGVLEPLIERTETLARRRAAPERVPGDPDPAGAPDETRSRALSRCVREMHHHLEDTCARRATERWVCLVGDGGVGKSHLLADLCRRHLGEGAPAVLVPGQLLGPEGFGGQLLERLDLQCSEETLFGALNAAAVARGTRALIAIDALNERRGGDGRTGIQAWADELPALLRRLEPFPDIALVLSCRTPHEQRALEHIPEHARRTLRHEGYAGAEELAFTALLDERGIARPLEPYPDPLLTLPLFLRLVTDALVREGVRAFPDTLRGAPAIFEYHFAKLSAAIEDRLGLDPDQRIPRRALDALLDEMHERRTTRLERARAIALLDEVYPSHGEARRSLLRALVEEGVLDVEHELGPTDDRAFVRFTFERYADFQLAGRFLDVHAPDLERARAAFAGGGPFAAWEHEPYRHAGLLEALTVLVPERLGVELLSLVFSEPGVDDPEPPTEDNEHVAALADTLWEAFARTLGTRPAGTVRAETRRLFEELRALNEASAFDVLLRAAAEPDHPLDAMYLHGALTALERPDRDRRWSAWLAVHWDDSVGGPTPAAARLIDWAWRADTATLSAARALRVAIALGWMLGAPDRALRDRTTKALVSLLEGRPDVLAELLGRFDGVDDLYVLERLFAAAYGVALRGRSSDDWSPLLDAIERLRAAPHRYPNALLLDHARGVIRQIGHLLSWPETEVSGRLPSFPESATAPFVAIEDFDEASHRESNPQAYFSATGGDFGRYVMSVVHRFSAARRDEPLVGAPVLRLTLLAELAKRSAALDAAVHALLTTERAFHAAVDAQRKGGSHGTLPVVIVPPNDPDDPVHVASRQEDEARDALVALMPPGDAERFRWLDGIRRCGPPPVSRRAAQRWIVRRVVELGWTPERFEWFEKIHARTTDRKPPRHERFGKKYQWLALHELVSHLIASHHALDWNGGVTGDVEEPLERLRDLDPSLLLDGTERVPDDDWPPPAPPITSRRAVKSTEEIRRWLESTDDLPADTSALISDDPDSSGPWWIVAGNVQHRPRLVPTPGGKVSMSSRTHSVLVPTARRDELVARLRTSRSIDPIGAIGSDHFGRYLGELTAGWIDDPAPTLPDASPLSALGIEIPFLTFRSSTEGSSDFSMRRDVSLHLPTRQLTNALCMHPAGDGRYESEAGQALWKNIGPAAPTAHAAFCRAEPLRSWLEAERLSLVWITTTSKGWLRDVPDFSTGTVIDHRVAWYDDTRLKGRRWADVETEEGWRRLRRVRDLRSGERP